MAEEVLYVAHEESSEAADRLIRFCEHPNVHNTNVSISVIPAYHKVDNLQSLKTELSKHPALRIGEVTVELRAKGPNQNSRPHVVYDATDSSTAKLILHQLQQLNEKDSPLLLGAIEEVFPVRPLRYIIADGLPEFLKAQVENHAEANNALQAAAAEITRSHSEKIKDFDAYWLRKNDELDQKITEADHAHQTKVLEDERRLKEQREKLEKERAEFELAEHRGVRRKLLTELEKVLSKQESLKSSSEGNKRYFTVFGVCGVVLFFSGVLIFSGTSYQIVSDPGLIDYIKLYVPLASGTLTAASTIVFLIRWLSGRAQRQADFDYQNARFRRDILRASWVAELLFEAHNVQEEGKEPLSFPESMIEHFCQDLFKAEAGTESEHPFDELKKHAKQFKKFSVGAKGIEVESKPEIGPSSPT